MKIGDDVAGFFWKNKMAVTTGTFIFTAATNPEPFVEGAVAIVNGPPVVIQSTGGPPVIQQRSGSDHWTGYAVLVGLLGVCGLILMYETGGRWSTGAKVVGFILLVGVVLFFCTTARADVLGASSPVQCTAWPSLGWGFWLNRLCDLLVILVLVYLPLT
jgi:hypothetical protein